MQLEVGGYTVQRATPSDPVYTKQTGFVPCIGSCTKKPPGARTHAHTHTVGENNQRMQRETDHQCIVQCAGCSVDEITKRRPTTTATHVTHSMNWLDY